MFKRKLTALEHINPESVNVNDDSNFKELIIWLEDQKIRHFKIEDRKSLKDTDSPQWMKFLSLYLKNLNCPINPNDRPAVTDWLLGLAVQLEYSDNTEKYNLETGENVSNRRKEQPKVVNTNPLDALDFQSPDFRGGVNQLAILLKINPHPDHLVTLKAISLFIQARLSQEAQQNPGNLVLKGKSYPIFEADLGFDAGDVVLNNAGKALRLLYIHDLRKLQTGINECIVACQTITANPKTDTKIGKVGR